MKKKFIKANYPGTSFSAKNHGGHSMRIYAALESSLDGNDCNQPEPGAN